MLTSLVLDALLILIILMMVPLGFLRGGLREVSTSAALLLGILMAEQWAAQWTGWLLRLFDMGEGAARFTMSILIVVVITGIVGYGGSAAFSWRPGPGGRMYGAYLALLNAVIFVGFLINSYIEQIFNGEVPETINRAYVSRAVSVGFEWMLLIGTLGVLGATLFGMIVRERGGEDEGFEKAPTAEDLYHIRYEQPRPQVRPLNDPEATQQTHDVPHKPVRIREVRHWEEEPPARIPDSSYGSGWRQTWPDDRGASTRKPFSGPSSSRSSAPSRDQSASGSQRDVLRDWMQSDKDKTDQD